MEHPIVPAPSGAPQDAQAQPEADRSNESALLTTGEMARLSNSTLRTVRFYEEEGILRPARRTEGGHRLFERTELDRLMLVTDLRMAGLSLDDIKKILEVKRAASSGAVAAENAIKVLGARIEELKEKLTVLNRLQDDLEETKRIVTGCMSCKTEQTLPDTCATCNVMVTQTALPRSVRVLWSISASAHESHRKAVSGEAAAEPEQV